MVKREEQTDAWELSENEEEFSESFWEKRGENWIEPVKTRQEMTAMPGRNLEQSTLNAVPVLGDAEILAAEALLDNKLLAVLLALGEKPRQAGELVGKLRVLAKKRIKVRKKVRVRDKTGWGYREVEREVEEERLVPSPIPASTLYRLLSRLKRAGLVEEYRGLDARRRYYRLTPLGSKIYEKARAHLEASLRKASRDNQLAWEKFVQICQSLGLDPSQLILALDLRVTEDYGKKQVHIPAKKHQGEKNP